MSEINYTVVELAPAQAAVTHTKARISSYTITRDPISSRVEAVVKYSLHATNGDFVGQGPVVRYTQWSEFPAGIKSAVLALQVAQLTEDKGSELEDGTVT